MADDEFEVVKATSVRNLKPPSMRKDNVLSLDDIRELKVRGIPERKIGKTVLEFFGVKMTFNSDGETEAHYYPYGEDAYKIRRLPKDFSWIGKSKELFGMNLFNSNGKRLIITEGELDTLSMAQASFDKYEKIYPVVSLSSASATKSILEHREWVRSFGEVILCLDTDEAGRAAQTEAIRIIGIDKVKLWKPPPDCKDACDVYLKHGTKTLMSLVFDAAPYIPAGIVGKDALWEALANYNAIASHPYPKCMDGVNEKLKGKRFGEITLFTSGTGSGKSSLLREIILDILETTSDSKIGIISLEESPHETARKLSGMCIGKNPAREEIPLAELKVGFDKAFGDNRITVLDHQGSISDNSIIDQLEYMALSGCNYLFIDHITILVSEGVENLTGNEAVDKMMNELLRLVKRHDIWIGLVSHLRKVQSGKTAFEEGQLPSLDDIKGSGSIKQISFDIIAFARNMTAADENERNHIKMRVLKSRYTGLTGDCNGLQYDYETGRMFAATNGYGDEFTSID
jgi:twinkle protein